ncbi:DUF6881 domain-containing protein [Spirosoma koreense]
MRYIQVDWIHNYPDDPTQLYSEVGEDGYEIRRIDIYRDGRIERVSEDTQDEYNFLNPQVYPSLEELNSKDEWDEVKAQEIIKDDFETIWANGLA